MKTKMGRAIIEGLNDVIEYEKGRKKLKTSSLEIPDPAPLWNQKKLSRLRKEVFKVSQTVFAAMLSVKPATIRAWEQGLKRPSGAASRLIQIIAISPNIFKKIAAHHPPY